MHTNPHPPWHLICKQALHGHSLETLSRQFAVPVSDIQARLDLATERTANAQVVRVRTQAEINLASAHAKSDLVTILQDAIQELKASPKDRLDQLDKFRTLLDAAARLFAWPTVSVARVSAFNQHPAGYSAQTTNGQPDRQPEPQTAVNLALIATTPDQLSRLAGRSTDHPTP